MIKYLDPKTSDVSEPGYYILDDNGLRRGGPFADIGSAEAHWQGLDPDESDDDDDAPSSPGP